MDTDSPGFSGKSFEDGEVMRRNPESRDVKKFLGLDLVNPDDSLLYFKQQHVMRMMWPLLTHLISREEPYLFSD